MIARRIVILILLPLAFVSFASAQVLFEDAFSHGKSPRWRQRNDGPAAGQFHVAPGQYELTSVDPLSSFPRALVRDSVKQNYFIEATVEITPVSHSFAAASLISYYNDSSHFYEFSLNQNASSWSLQKTDKSGLSILAGGNVPFRASSYRLGLHVQEKAIRAFVNGVLVAETSVPSPLNGGDFGISARGARTIWRSVVVKASHPDDFPYRFLQRKTDNHGIAVFPGASFLVVDESGQALSGIEVTRIQRDAISYLIFRDTAGKRPLRSGFFDEFPLDGANRRRVTFVAAPSRTYSRLQLEWLFGFFKNSTNLAKNGVIVDLQSIPAIYFESGTWQVLGAPANDLLLGSPESPVESSAMLFGKWDETGNYDRFPVVGGVVHNSNALISQLASLTRVPSHSLFTLHVLKLQGAAVSWFVQEDSRAFLYAQDLQFPDRIRASATYRIPFTIVNGGERSGTFKFSIVLSQNSTTGKSDRKLAENVFSGLEAGGNITSELSITIPADLPAGRYFLGTFLESDNIQTRVANTPSTVRAVATEDLPGPGNMKVTLQWTGAADLDLHVIDPFRETIYYFQPQSTTSGSLLSDGECATNTEQVEYENGKAPSGTYSAFIHYFRTCGGAGDVNWTLTADVNGNTQSFSGKIHPGEYLKVSDFGF